MDRKLASIPTSTYIYHLYPYIPLYWIPLPGEYPSIYGPVLVGYSPMDVLYWRWVSQGRV